MLLRILSIQACTWKSVLGIPAGHLHLGRSGSDRRVSIWLNFQEKERGADHSAEESWTTVDSQQATVKAQVIEKVLLKGSFEHEQDRESVFRELQAALTSVGLPMAFNNISGDTSEFPQPGFFDEEFDDPERAKKFMNDFIKYQLRPTFSKFTRKIAGLSNPKGKCAHCFPSTNPFPVNTSGTTEKRSGR